MVKLILAVLLFLISLLTVFKAPAYALWLLAILIDEFPWIPILLTILLLVLNLRTTAYPLAANSLLLLAFILFLSPVLRANLVSKYLRNNLISAFGELPEQGSKPAFLATKMFCGNDTVACKTLAYASEGKNLLLDFYPASATGKRPCVIVVHGGSWKSGDSKQLPELNSYLAKQGYQVAAINYRLAPGAKCPAQVEDVADALTFLKTRSDEWKIDTSQFVLLGRSAGAQIALLAAYTLKDPDIKGVIDFYGPADMVWGYSIPSNPLIMDSRKVMEDYLGGTYQAYPQYFENSSPLLHVTRQSPPTLLMHGQNDVLVAYEHSKRLNEALKENGVKHYLLTLPWATHGFDYNFNGPGAQLSTYAVSYFLKSVTN
jgi:acetyl esterase/lipase